MIVEGLLRLLGDRNTNGAGDLTSPETLVETLQSQAPAFVETFQSITSWSTAASTCPTRGCNGAIKSASGTRTPSLLSFRHEKQYDDNSTQKTYW